MLDLIIINPTAAHGIKGGHAIYGDLGENLVAIEQPLWVRLIAGYIRDKEFKLQIIDAEAMKWTPEEVATEVAQKRPRLVAIAVYGHMPSASTQQMDGASTTAKKVREAWPEAKIMMLGGHVSALPERTLREETAIDYVCVGEGPITIARMLSNRHWMPSILFEIPGLGFWDENREVVISPRAEELPLEELHGDVWDMLPMHLYKSHNWQAFGNLAQRQPYASVYTTLNCPYSCSFCCIAAPFGNRKYRMRKPQDVVNEIETLILAYNVKTFKIVDEMFVLNKAHYEEICRLLEPIHKRHDINIWAYARVDTVRPENLTMLRNAGIKWLALGIESGSKYVRDGANKRLKNDDILSVVRAIQRHDINVIGNYIFGLPDDDAESMNETLNLSILLNTEFANFYSAQAYPGSPLYEEALKKGWALPKTWAGYSQHNRLSRPLDTQHIHGAQVLKFRDDAFNIYFRNTRYQEMVLKKFGKETLEHVKEMTKYELPRDLVDEFYAPKNKASSH